MYGSIEDFFFAFIFNFHLTICFECVLVRFQSNEKRSRMVQAIKISLYINYIVRCVFMIWKNHAFLSLSLSFSANDKNNTDFQTRFFFAQFTNKFQKQNDEKSVRERYDLKWKTSHFPTDWMCKCVTSIAENDNELLALRLLSKIHSICFLSFCVRNIKEKSGKGINQADVEKADVQSEK